MGGCTRRFQTFHTMYPANLMLVYADIGLACLLACWGTVSHVLGTGRLSASEEQEVDRVGALDSCNVAMDFQIAMRCLVALGTAAARAARTP